LKGKIKEMKMRNKQRKYEITYLHALEIGPTYHQDRSSQVQKLQRPDRTDADWSYTVSCGLGRLTDQLLTGLSS
jgi:hypothetical protein